jgi:hypothetical protein
MFRRTQERDDEVRRIFLNGTAMTGQPDHDAIAGATLLGEVRTAPRYRFVAVRDAFPGLIPVEGTGGTVVGELYELTEAILFESLLPREPPELELGTIELANGDIVNSMQLQPDRLGAEDKVVDITHLQGWRMYQAFLQANAPGALDWLWTSKTVPHP